MQSIFDQLVANLRTTSLAELVAVVFGIASVWFSRKENILVYPVGLVNTIGYVYISLKSHLLGEASVNFYYTVVSIYGWVMWARKDRSKRHILQITSSNSKEWMQHILFFAVFYISIFAGLSYLKRQFLPGALPAADAFASATAFTGMWLMAKKKVESWYWWIATNVASIPLYFVKGLAFTSFYYLVLLILAVSGLSAWRRKVEPAT